MSILRFFGLGYPGMSHYPHGDYIEYRTRYHKLCVSFTSGGENRIYTDSIARWEEYGNILTREEKTKILADIVSYVRREFYQNPVIVIHIERDKEFWEGVTSKLKGKIHGVEYIY
jgi:hypothetical protein